MPSQYDPLYRYLQDVPAGRTELTLTFAQVESIPGVPLPPTARKRPQWWATDHTTHVQARAWQDAGWRASPKLREALVVFTREAL